MIKSHNQFIATYENAFPKSFCDELIDLFEKRTVAGKIYDRSDREKNTMLAIDHSFNLNPLLLEELHSLDKESLSLIKDFHNFFSKCYDDYLENYPYIRNLGNKFIKTYKVQKTLPSQGYHIWHCENDGTPIYRSRILVYTVFLNDVEEGGETEFLYQSLRAKPSVGKCLIWPAHFGYAHRGNPPLSGEKYIITGWIE